MKHITAILLAISLIFMGGFGTANAEQLKIGVISMRTLIDQYQGAKLVEKKINQQFAERKARLQGEENELSKLDERLKRDGATMTAAQKSGLERELRDRARDHKRAVDDFQEDYNIARNEGIGKVLREVNEAVKNFAEKEKYDLIMQEEGVFASARVNITEKILKMLNDQYKASGK